ncbi:hypothetical protein FRC08_006917, partial [Ceratobasidium sp. 394]
MAAADVRSSKKARYSYPPGSDANTITQENACQQVVSARARLSYAIEDYHTACQLLASTCVPRPQYSDQHSRELVLSTIGTELSILEEEGDRIQTVHRILVDARNKTNMTAPIYSLPPEILTRIFLEAVCHHAHDESERPTCFPSNPVTLSAVCKQWRNIIINRRSVWAHLDILIDEANRWSRYPSSQLWISRLQGTPLRVHIRQYDPTIHQHSLDHSTHSDDDSDDLDNLDDSDDLVDSDDSGTSA